MRQGVQFDEVHCGTLPRQSRTEQVVKDSFHAAALPWPDARASACWNEYDASGVLDHLVPADPRLAALADEFARARSGPDANRSFQRMFEASMLCWLEGAASINGMETWPGFRSRVSAALAQIREGPPKRRVAVFTSGGVIGCAVHLALQAPPKAFLDINWRIRNCSVTQFVFDEQRFTLDSFNGIPHLDDPALRTYR
jgi:broad specificity phosphatase PhoE